MEYSSGESGILHTVHHKRSIFADSILLPDVREEECGAILQKIKNSLLKNEA